MYTKEDFLDYRKSLDILRNELNFSICHNTTSLLFMQEAEKFLVLIDAEHEHCNNRIGELTE